MVDSVYQKYVVSVNSLTTKRRAGAHRVSTAYMAQLDYLLAWRWNCRRRTSIYNTCGATRNVFFFGRLLGWEP